MFAKTSLRFLLAATLACSMASLHALPATAQAAGAESAPVRQSQYVLRFGDALNMRVVGNEALTIEKQPIRPDGRVSLPLIGDMQAGGLTVPQLQERVTKAYTKYFVDPKIIVNVAEFRPLTISVLGWVRKPDTFKVVEPVPLINALALAGGADPRRGDLTRVLVLRPSGERMVIDVTSILEGHTENNVTINDGDTIRVEEVPGPDWYVILPPIAQIATIIGTLALAYQRVR